MSKTYATIFFLFLTCLSRYVAATEIPELVKKDINLKIQMKACQAQWALESELYHIHKLNSNQQLIFIPCSNWGYNTNWLAYFHIYNKIKATSYLKPLLFVRYRSSKGIYADNTISNLRWNPEILEITSFRTKNGTNLCGDLTGFTWDNNSQEFKYKGLIKKDDCNSTENWKSLSISWE